MSEICCRSCDIIYVNEKEYHNHLDKNEKCLKWIELLDKNDEIARVVEVICSIQNTNEFRCNSCNTVYSNLGNMNKHFKNHPECMRMHYYGLITMNKRNEEIEEIDKKYIENTELNYDRMDNKYNYNDVYFIGKNCVKKSRDMCESILLYYKGWPNNCPYIEDLNWARDKSIEYLDNVCVKMSEKERKNKICMFDLDDTILFGDPAEVLGIREMDLGYEGDHPLFILPINMQIVEIIKHAKKCGFLIYIATARPIESKKASEMNLNMFGIEYDNLFMNNMDEYPIEFKYKVFKSLKDNLIYSIGDKSTDISRPFGVKLPDPTTNLLNDLCVRIYE